MFKATNKTVSCAGKSGYFIMETAPKAVPHPTH